MEQLREFDANGGADQVSEIQTDNQGNRWYSDLTSDGVWTLTKEIDSSSLSLSCVIEPASGSALAQAQQLCQSVDQVTAPGQKATNGQVILRQYQSGLTCEELRIKDLLTDEQYQTATGSDPASLLSNRSYQGAYLTSFDVSDGSYGYCVTKVQVKAGSDPGAYWLPSQGYIVVLWDATSRTWQIGISATGQASNMSSVVATDVDLDKAITTASRAWKITPLS